MSAFDPPTANVPAGTGMLPAATSALLFAALKRPGQLYQPLVLTNVVSVEILIREIAQQAPNLRIARSLDEMADGTLATALLISDESTKTLPPDWFEWLPSSCQVLLWSRGANVTLLPAAADWASAGLSVSTRKPADVTSQQVESSLQLALTRVGRVCNPLILCCEPERIAQMSLQISLVASRAGVTTVLEKQAPFNARSWGPLERPARESVALIHLRNYDPSCAEDEPFRDALEQAILAHAQLVLLADIASYENMSASRQWRTFLSSGLTLNTTSKGQAGQDVFNSLALSWPDAGEVLAGRPFRRERPKILLDTTMSLDDVLQLVGMSRFSGRLITFTPFGYGTIEFRKGTIIHAGPTGTSYFPSVQEIASRRGLGDALNESLSAEVVMDRLWEMALWAGGRSVFIDTEPELPVEEAAEIPAQAALMEIARRADEWKRMLRIHALDSSLWTVISSTDTSAVGIDRAVTAAASNPASLLALSQQTGFGRFDVAQAILRLVDSHVIGKAGDADPLVAGTDTGTVVRALYAEGLAREAVELIESSNLASSADPSLSYALAWIAIERGEEAQAAACFSSARHSEDVVTRSCASFNLLLLDVRAGRTQPEVGWAAIEKSGILTRAAEPSARPFLAVAAEVAIRGGHKKEAGRFIDLLDDPSLAAALSRQL